MNDPVSMWYILLELAGLDVHASDGPEIVTPRLHMNGHTEWKRHHVEDAYAGAKKAAEAEWAASQ